MKPSKKPAESQSRGSGKTTKQMVTAKKNSDFIWCNNHLEYPRALARRLDRQDLVLHRLSILDGNALCGRELVDVVVDHAIELTTTQAQNISILSAQTA